MKKILLATLILSIVFNACKKEANSYNTTDSTELSADQLSAQELQNLDAAGVDTTSTFEDARLPDGTKMKKWLQDRHIQLPLISGRDNVSLSPSDERELFITNMTNGGFKLVNYIVSSQPNGLAYINGSKTYDVATVGKNSVCTQPMFGLDCSGMIYQMAKESSLDIPKNGGTYGYVSPSTWNLAFQKSRNYKNLEMIDSPNLDASRFQPGDIIVSSGKHMGMVFQGDNGLEIFNSAGSPDSTCKYNSNAKHGPVINPNISLWLKIFKNGYEVLRTKLIDSTFTDPRDKQIYTFKHIGTQVWMTQNLNFKTGSSSQYGNSKANGVIYGSLYTWDDALNAAPTGWHVPALAEWNILSSYLGGANIAGGALKDTSNLWSPPNTGATNSSGFRGLGGGNRNPDGTYASLGVYGLFWTSSLYSATNTGYYEGLYYQNGALTEYFATYNSEGLSVRCVRNN